jgi:hypothetical protein
MRLARPSSKAMRTRIRNEEFAALRRRAPVFKSRRARDLRRALSGARAETAGCDPIAYFLAISAVSVVAAVRSTRPARAETDPHLRPFGAARTISLRAACASAST